jgi:RNA polymerase sigma-70 factor (ECF subfamily)
VSAERAGDIRAEILDRVRLRFALDLAAFEGRVREALASGMRLDRLALDDLYLATACAAGEEAAWEELSQRHFGFIRDFSLRCARRDPPAGDVAERVIADLWQRGKIRQFAGRSTLRTWLGTVVAHAASNALEARGRIVPLERAGDRAAEPEADGPDRAALARIAAEALRALPPDARLLLLLYYEQGSTLEEVGALLGASKAALSRRLAKIRAALRADIESRSEAGTAGRDFTSVDLDLAALLAAAPEVEKNSERSVKEE